MGYQFNPLILLGLDLVGAPSGSASYRDPVATEGDLPTVGNSDGDVRVVKATDHIYVWNTGSSTWIDTGITLASAIGSTPNNAGVVINQVVSGNITHQELQLEPADATHPGVITTGSQTIAGNKTLSGTTNLSGLTASTPLKLDGSKNIISAAIDLTTDVTAVLPIANGGTNSGTSLSGNKAIVSNGSAIVESSVTSTEIGYVSGVTGPIQDQIDSKIFLTEKGANNGVATLDAGGKVPVGQLPSSVVTYEGTWDASTNTPTLADGTGDAGMVYITNVAGTTDFGSGPITFALGDWAIYNGTIWQKSINSNAVVSVNGQTGVVSLSTTDIAEGTNLYYTDLRAQASITGGASTIVTSDLASNFALESDGSGKVVVSSVTSTELGYVSGVTSSIQNQIDTKTTRSAGDITETSFSGANNQSSASDVTGLVFANGVVRSFEALVSVYINATGSLYEVFKLRGIQKGASWDLAYQSAGDTSGVIFSITAAGQVQYQSTNITGFTASTFKFRAITTSV